MKKILILLVMLFTITLIGCGEEPYNYTPDIQDLQNQINEQQTQIDLMQDAYSELYEDYDEMYQILEDIGVIEGLNGQRAYYLPTALSLELLGTELDKDKAPDYVLDINGDYISFETVADLLVEKYFGNLVTVDEAVVGFQLKMVLSHGDITANEFMARLIFMINELSLYDFYIIGSSEIYIQTVYGGTSYIKIPMQTLRSDFITLTPEVIYSGTYEIQLFQMAFNKVTVQTLYDDFVLNETFTGYVLDY